MPMPRPPAKSLRKTMCRALPRPATPRTFPDMEKINLVEKFSRFTDHWSPKIAAELNGQHVKLVKFRGEFVWHHHEHEDELFLVVRGSFSMEFRDRPGAASRQVELSEGEM